MSASGRWSLSATPSTKFADHRTVTGLAQLVTLPTVLFLPYGPYGLSSIQASVGSAPAVPFGRGAAPPAGEFTDIPAAGEVLEHRHVASDGVVLNARLLGDLAFSAAIGQSPQHRDPRIGEPRPFDLFVSLLHCPFLRSAEREAAPALFRRLALYHPEINANQAYFCKMWSRTPGTVSRGLIQPDAGRADSTWGVSGRRRCRACMDRCTALYIDLWAGR